MWRLHSVQHYLVTTLVSNIELHVLLEVGSVLFLLLVRIQGVSHAHGLVRLCCADALSCVYMTGRDTESPHSVGLQNAVLLHNLHAEIASR